jgi:hypothetical protein
MVARSNVILLSLLFFVGCGVKEIDLPRIVKARFLVKNLTVENQIHASSSIVSPLPTSIHYNWSINGIPVYDSVGAVLSPAYYTKHDIIECEVIAIDTKNKQSEPYKIGPIEIQNSLPKVAWADFHPNNSIHKGVDLSIIQEKIDPDSDNVSIIYKWYLNDRSISTDSVLDGNLLVAGKTLWAKIIPYDGESFGDTFELPRRIIVQNHPPKIIGATEPVLDNDVITCRVDIIDPDGDEITYCIEEGPCRMTIDCAGRISWEKPEEIKDTTYTIVVKAIDSNGGQSAAKFKIRFSLL